MGNHSHAGRVPLSNLVKIQLQAGHVFSNDLRSKRDSFRIDVIRVGPVSRHAANSPDKLLSFRKTLCALFRPFRHQHDFGETIEDFHSKFDIWWTTGESAGARQYVKLNDDYYTSRELARERDDEDVSRYNNYSACSDENESRGDFCDTDSNDHFLDFINEEGDDDYDEFVDGDAFVPRATTMKHISILNKSTDSVALAAASASRIVDEIPRIERISMKTLDRMISDADKKENAEEVHASISSKFPALETRVQLVPSAITNVEWAESANPPDETLNYCPTLQDVSNYFSLNRKQHTAFVKVGTKLLKRFVENNSPDQQLIGFVGGLPGAGKSQVIRALQKLSCAWHYPKAVATAAYHNVAAQAAGGQTIHKLFGWRVNCDQSKWKPTLEKTERFHKIKLLIIDEISTCDVHILGRIDTSLRIILKQPLPWFGGIHILLVGDWLQQLPVAGQPAFLPIPQYTLSDTSRETKDAAVYLDRVRGADAYQHVNTVIILDENMRHKSDPLWRDILQRWRVGNYLQSDIDIVNRICHDENWSGAHMAVETFCPIIVTSNELRSEFNWSALRKFCLKTGRPLHQFRADVTRARFPLSNILRRAIQSVRDDKTGGMPVILSFAVGIPVQCTKNTSDTLKLANGTIGYVVDFVADAQVTVEESIVDGITFHYHSQPPQAVHVKLIGHDDTSFLPYLPRGVVPLLQRVEKGVTIHLPSRSFNVTVKQIPMVPAFAPTTEKCQGLTVEKMVLGPSRLLELKRSRNFI